VTVTVNTADFAVNVTGTSASPTVAITVPAGFALPVLLVHDRSESTTITSITDTGSGTWNLIDGPISHTTIGARGWQYYRTGGSAGAITITVNFAAAVSQQLAAGSVVSDVSALTLDASDATPAEFATGTTSHTTDSVNASAAGVPIGGLLTNNSVSLSAVGTGETNATNTTGRVHITAEPLASGGAATLEATSGGAASLFFAAAFVESGASSGVPRFMNVYRRRRSA
jgi:hypothetical protein